MFPPLHRSATPQIRPYTDPPSTDDLHLCIVCILLPAYDISSETVEPKYTEVVRTAGVILTYAGFDI